MYLVLVFPQINRKDTQMFESPFENPVKVSQCEKIQIELNVTEAVCWYLVKVVLFLSSGILLPERFFANSWAQYRH